MQYKLRIGMEPNMLYGKSNKPRNTRRLFGNVVGTCGIILVVLSVAILVENFYFLEQPLWLTTAIALIICVLGIMASIFGFMHNYYKFSLQLAKDNNPHQYKVVVIGGGTGLSMLLRGLKEYPIDVSAIVTVADDGGSSGRLRDEMEMPPPGDIRNVLVALADTEPLLEKLLQHRFNRGKNLSGHSIGNLLLAALQEITGDFKSAIREMSRVLAIRGKVIPVAEDLVQLVAKMKDGRVVRGESTIPKAGGVIQRVFLEPTNINATPEAIEAIAEADLIVVGPGSLYTSVLPALLVNGIADAIRQANATKVYVCNIMTQRGETERYTAYDHIKAIYNHIGHEFFDAIVCHSGKVPDAVNLIYDRQGAGPVEVKIDKLKRLGLQVITKDLSIHQTYYRHDPQKVSELIVNILVEKPMRERQVMMEQ